MVSIKRHWNAETNSYLIMSDLGQIKQNKRHVICIAQDETGH